MSVGARQRKRWPAGARGALAAGLAVLASGLGVLASPAPASAQAGTGTVAGRAVDEANGDPIEQICVQVLALDGTVLAEGTSDSGGNYSLSGVAPGEHKLSFQSCGSRSYVAEYFDNRQGFAGADTISVAAGETTFIDVELRASGRISGRISGPTQEDLVDICVQVYDAGDPDALVGVVNSGSDGRYTIQNLPTGSYKVRYSGCGADSFIAEWHSNARSFAAADAIDVIGGVTVAGVDAQLEQAGVISGTVTGPTGSTLANICVYALDASGQLVEGDGTEAGTGNYAIDNLPAGYYRVQFQDCVGGVHATEYYEGATTFEDGEFVAVTVEETTSGIDAQLEVAGTIFGHLTDTSGNPVEGACVTAYEPDYENIAVGYGFSAADGSYVLTGLPTGSFRVRYDGSCAVPAAPSEFYDDQEQFVTSSPVAVLAGSDTLGIDAELDGGRPPGVAITAGPSGPTQNQRPSFSFVTQSGFSAQCSLDTGTASYGPCSAAASHQPVANLADGAYTFRVRASDGLGNVQTAIREFSVDTQAPALAITGGPSGPTNQARPAFTFNPEFGTTLRCSIDTGIASFGPCSGVTAHQPSANLANSNFTFRVRATDAAGNVSVQTRDFTVDTIGPDVAIDSGPDGPTQERRPTFAFTVDPGSGLECSIDTGAPSYGPCSGAASHQPAGNLADGTYTFRIKATDPLANPTVRTRTFTVDTVAPSVAVTGGPNGLTNEPRPAFSFSAEAGAGVECAIASAAPSYAACSGTAGHQPAANLPQGDQAFHVRATDAAGNTAAATRSFTVDTIAPSVSIGAGPSGPTRETRPSFAFAAESGSTLACSIDSGTPSWGACGSGSSHQAASGLPDGEHAFRVRATDAAGNSTTAERGFRVDTRVAPLAITGGPGAATSDPRPSFTFEAEAGSALECSIDSAGPSWQACDSGSSYRPAADLANGSYTFRLRATDALGNSAEVSRAFTVDASAPGGGDAACADASAQLASAKAKLKKAKKSGAKSKIKKAKAKVKKAQQAVDAAC